MQRMSCSKTFFTISIYMLAFLPASLRAFVGPHTFWRLARVTPEAVGNFRPHKQSSGSRSCSIFSESTLHSTDHQSYDKKPRKEKRPRSKQEITNNFQKPIAPAPLKIANVKPCDISQINELAFDMIIDVRTPAEFEIDHIPGSVNHPVLDNDERITIGTLHNGNVFEARRRGAALISRRIADLLENEFKDQPKNWRPLIVCWRGGLRSGSLAIVLAQVGWQVHQLTGGYKSYRRELMEILPVLCKTCILKIVSAPTGSGKTHFLGALKRAGKQVIDLEALASHRGSVLGNIPGEKQPSQRLFDTRLLLAFKELDITKPIYIESESRKIGSVALPEQLSRRMHESQCLFLDVPKSERVKVLLIDYLYFIENPIELLKQLSYLAEYRGVEKLEEWNSLVKKGDFGELVLQLLDLHYDPLYWKSLRKNYPQIDNREVTQQLIVNTLSSESLDEAVTRIEETDYQYPISDEVSVVVDVPGKVVPHETDLDVFG